MIVGGNAAGMSAAAKAKRRKPDLDVTVIEAGLNVSYSSCGIPHYVAGTIEDPEDLIVLKPDETKARGIDVMRRTRATGFNAYTKKVSVQTPSGRDDVAYDKLLLAMGTEPLNPFPGGELEGVFTLRHIGDGVRLLTHLESHKAKKVAIVGGGFLGLEMAEAFRRREAKVTLLQRGDRLMSMLDPDITQGLDAMLDEAGVHVVLNAEVKGFAPREGKGDGTRLGSVLADKDVDADAAIVAIGVRPATEWAVKAGLDCTPEGYILTDTQMKTNLHDVYAAGDCVAPTHLVTEKPTPMPLALPANRMGHVAGDNIAHAFGAEGAAQHFTGVVGTAVTQVFGVGIAKTGLTETEAKEHDFEALSFLLESPNKAAYMPDAADMAVKLVADGATGRVLGAQIVGPAESAIRIDMVAVALRAKMTVRQLAEVETAYAPTFSPVYDPVVNAATQLAKLLRK